MLIQETAAGESSPILRGLTGHQTLPFIDGVRLSMFRSGPNQYLSFIHPSQTDRVEALLGSSAASFGSDSLGGTVNVTTASPKTTEGQRLLTGDLSLRRNGRLERRLAQPLPRAARRVSSALGGFTQRNNTLRTAGAADFRNVPALLRPGHTGDPAVDRQPRSRNRLRTRRRARQGRLAAPPRTRR